MSPHTASHLILHSIASSLRSRPNIYVPAGVLENKYLQTAPDRENAMEFNKGLSSQDCGFSSGHVWM